MDESNPSTNPRTFVKSGYRHWIWLLLLFPVVLGLRRLHLDVEILNLLPGDSRVVQGLKLYQENFSNARELIITVESTDAEVTEQAALKLAEALRHRTDQIDDVTAQPPWLEHPDQAAELVAFLWLNQPPDLLQQLSTRLARTNLSTILSTAREQLATSMSPGDIAQLSYDPYGFARLPESATPAAPDFGRGQQFFMSADGTFRIIFVKARGDLSSYRECARWLGIVKETVESKIPPAEQMSKGIWIGYTGRPAFVSEIAGGMERDTTASVGGTALIIAVLFWLAHRRWKPMLWLLTLLALVLISTLGIGGLIFGTINVVSVGFAAILLGLAVDYAVVHYQEAIAHPDLSVPEIRRMIAPSIFWAAVTTITAFLVLNFGGLPGLAQLGSLVGLGVGLSALVMIFAFLPPLFRDRLVPKVTSVAPAVISRPKESSNPDRSRVVKVVTALLVIVAAIVLSNGLPRIDATANALRPRNSPSYAALETIKARLNQSREPIWLLVGGRSETEIAGRLQEVRPILDRAMSNQEIAGFTLPDLLWPRPDYQFANRATAGALVEERGALLDAAAANGFAGNSMLLTSNILETWQRAIASTNVLWPTNRTSQWVFQRLVARANGTNYALGLIHPAARVNSASMEDMPTLAAGLPQANVWLSGWELLGASVFQSVKENLWKLILPMLVLVLLSLWLAFRRIAEVLLSLAILVLSGLCLLTVMHLAGWSWTLLSLMSLPLILGTGVDYSIFMQLALRRHGGDQHDAHRSVGRALLLCGATAVTGFGSLAWSGNTGMASLGQVCAIGIGSNMLISVFLLPAWWSALVGKPGDR